MGLNLSNNMVDDQVNLTPEGILHVGVHHPALRNQSAVYAVYFQLQGLK